MTYSRNEERIKVMEALYQIFVYLENNNDNYDSTQIILDEYKVNLFSLVPDFSKVIYVTSLDNIDEIIKKIEPNLNKWTFSRINNVAKAILVLALAECNYAKLNNKKIVINSYIDISKKYLQDGDYKFINAVLDKVLI